MRRAAGLLLASLVLAGCGGDDTKSKPPAGKPKAAATPDGCAEAEKKIAALTPPKNIGQIGDYAAAAADALPASRPTRAALLDLELPAFEKDVERLRTKLDALGKSATDECGERAAYEKLDAAFRKLTR